MWSWDITYLNSPLRGMFWYLYLIMDIWSRRIIGRAVYPTQSDPHAVALFTRVCNEQTVSTTGLVLDADNGSPMKGATMLATVERLGGVPPFSRPRVSDDNPYSETLLCTLKYYPAFPSQPRGSLDAARTWVDAFVIWNNHDHQHSAIQFLKPDDPHAGRDVAIKVQRAIVIRRRARSIRHAGAATPAIGRARRRCISTTHGPPPQQWSWERTSYENHLETHCDLLPANQPSQKQGSSQRVLDKSVRCTNNVHNLR